MSTFIVKFSDIITSTYQSYFTENLFSILLHILFEHKVACYLYFLSSPFSEPVTLQVQFWNLPSLKLLRSSVT